MSHLMPDKVTELAQLGADLLDGHAAEAYTVRLYRVSLLPVLRDLGHTLEENLPTKPGVYRGKGLALVVIDEGSSTIHLLRDCDGTQNGTVPGSFQDIFDVVVAKQPPDLMASLRSKWAGYGPWTRIGGDAA